MADTQLKLKRCLSCRWWTGDRDTSDIQYHTESERRGDCERIVASPALRDETAARLYPVNSGAVLSTRFDFSCSQWEKL